MIKKPLWVITRTFDRGIFDDEHEYKDSVIVRKARRRRQRVHNSRRPKRTQRTSFDDRYGFEDDFFSSTSQLKRYMSNHNLTSILDKYK